MNSVFAVREQVLRSFHWWLAFFWRNERRHVPHPFVLALGETIITIYDLSKGWISSQEETIFFLYQSYLRNRQERWFELCMEPRGLACGLPHVHALSQCPKSHSSCSQTFNLACNCSCLLIKEPGCLSWVWTTEENWAFDIWSQQSDASEMAPAICCIPQKMIHLCICQLLFSWKWDRVNVHALLLQSSLTKTC